MEAPKEFFKIEKHPLQANRWGVMPKYKEMNPMYFYILPKGQAKKLKSLLDIQARKEYKGEVLTLAQ